MPEVPNYEKPRMKHIPIDTDGAVLAQEFNDNKQKINGLIVRNKLIRKALKKKDLIDGSYYNKSIKLYALRLEHGCWYIGQARDPERRFKKHGGGGGALWTKKHHPIEIVEIRDTGLTNEGEVARLENEMTVEYALKYGIDCVRGGGYSQVVSPTWPVHMREADLSWIMQEVA